MLGFKRQICSGTTLVQESHTGFNPIIDQFDTHHSVCYDTSCQPLIHEFDGVTNPMLNIPHYSEIAFRKQCQ